MSSTRLMFGAIWVALLLVSRGIWPASTLPVDVHEHPQLVGGPWEPHTVRVDLYGNEIEPAVTDYRLDQHGDVYERHAPHTALPSPKRPET